MSIKVAIADDSASIRLTVRRFISAKTGWEICGEAENGEAALFLVQRHKPDVLILDLAMPVMNGLDAAWWIRIISPKTRIVLFTGHACEQVLREAKNVGIRAVIAKDRDAALQRLIATLREETDSFQAA